MPSITVSLSIVAKVPFVPRKEKEDEVAAEIIRQAFLGDPDPYGFDGIFYLYNGRPVPFDIESVSLEVRRPPRRRNPRELEDG